MTTILVGGGFIASHLLQHHATPKIIGFDSKTCDLLNPAAITQALDRIPAISEVIFTAAITRLRANDSPSKSANIDMVRNFLSYCEKKPPRHLIFFSTIDVYGLVNDRTRLTEQSPLNPDDYYAASKVEGERLIQNASGRLGFKTTIFRLPGIYGKGDVGRSTISKLVRAAVENRAILLEGGGTSLRDFVYVKDLCKLVIAALDRSVTGIFNVAAGRSHSIKQIAEIISQQFSFPVELKISQRSSGLQRAPGLVFDTTALRNAFPEVNMTSLRDGVSEYLNECAL